MYLWRTHLAVVYLKHTIREFSQNIASTKFMNYEWKYLDISPEFILPKDVLSPVRSQWDFKWENSIRLTGYWLTHSSGENNEQNAVYIWKESGMLYRHMEKHMLTQCCTLSLSKWCIISYNILNTH